MASRLDKALGFFGLQKTASLGSPTPTLPSNHPFSVPANGVDGLEAGSARRRLANFRPGANHVNNLIQQAGATVNQRARWLVRNNAYAINAVDWWASAVVGPGITPSWSLPESQIELKRSLRSAWDNWTDEADSEGLTDFYGMMRRAVRETFIVGECFVRVRFRRPQDGMDVPLQLQMLPSEMLDTSDNRQIGAGNFVRQGIEFDAIGRRVAYWFYKVHPHDMTESARALADNKTRVPAAEIIHLMDPVEAGQLRGLSRFANVTAQLFMLDQYDDAELERKKTAALFAGFIKRPAELDPEENIVGGPLVNDAGLLVGHNGGPPLDEVVASLEAGTMQVLLPGEEVAFSMPADVGGNYEAFQFRSLLRIAVGLGVPYHGLTGDMTKGNYGNTRASSLDARRRTEAFQWGVVVFGLCRKVMNLWIEQAALNGKVPGFSLATYEANTKLFRKVRWMPPPWGWVDPKKDVEANVLDVQHGFRARSEIVEANGYDAEETDRRRKEDKDREDRLGLAPPPPPTVPGAGAGRPPGQGNRPNEEDE